ncbi:hypothetical protein UFOVP1516_6 [uncultured Caudovirales phage]|uniref:Uncharacterized protein n=1 Tax=uncultured Caudovirales phage TaxID=2100421 RepID=A0A6J7XCI2_9CAUD|nr:hypothetical protein UFOVP887_38 [uncultured Caudovirales phage]CAB5226673.1 hypothetical protein UFOVP1516_6 [uncultured Caudovirales phage]
MMMNNLNKQEQEKLLQFVKFLQSYNPEYRMADGMKTQFLQLRKEVLVILDKQNGY